MTTMIDYRLSVISTDVGFCEAAVSFCESVLLRSCETQDMPLLSRKGTKVQSIYFGGYIVSPDDSN